MRSGELASDRVLTRSQRRQHHLGRLRRPLSDGQHRSCPSQHPGPAPSPRPTTLPNGLRSRLCRVLARHRATNKWAWLLAFSPVVFLPTEYFIAQFTNLSDDRNRLISLVLLTATLPIAALDS